MKKCLRLRRAVARFAYGGIIYAFLFIIDRPRASAASRLRFRAHHVQVVVLLRGIQRHGRDAVFRLKVKILLKDLDKAACLDARCLVREGKDASKAGGKVCMAQLVSSTCASGRRR